MKSFGHLTTVGKTNFSTCNSESIPLLSVKAGVSIEDALEHASCLLGCVKDLTLIDSIDAPAGVRVWSAHYLGEMAKAIIDDVAASINRSRAQP
jgi:hypothetical protein